MELKTIKQMADALKNKATSAVELCQDALNKSNTIGKDINCFISINADQALADAQAADEKLADANLAKQRDNSPLCGIPIAHKDLFCTEAITTTCGSKMLANFIPPYTATLVNNLKQNGAVAIGKTNMDEFAMGSSNTTSYYGRVLNPRDHSRIPGGSSGGSAAAVAAGIVPATTASDTGGSIRQPAALCGITGLKPTYGRVSRYGMVAFASSLDQAGVMAKTAEDCAMLLQGMMGYDALDSTSAKRAPEAINRLLDNDLTGKKIGIATNYFDNRLNSKSQQLLEQALQQLEQAGAKLIDITLPNSKYSVAVYYTIASAECSSNLSRFDGIRFGHRSENSGSIDKLISNSRGEGFGDEVKRRILVGTYVLSAAYFDAYYLKALTLREAIKQDLIDAFKKVDVIAAPTCPSIAPKFDDTSIQGTEEYYQDVYTISSNLSGLPALSMPCGFSDGLPVGMQLIGNYFDEAQLLSVAHNFQKITDWHTR